MYLSVYCKNIMQFFIIYFITFGLLYIVSPCTSPSNPYTGIDESVFFTVGSSLLEGYLPYRDLFDHKGPLLYYIYAIAQYDSFGKMGIFVLQTLAWSISIFAVWKTFRLFIKREFSMLLLVVFSFCSFPCIEGGGLTEEWSLPVSCVLLYIVLQNLKSHNSVSGISGWIWLSLGSGVAWHSLLRITNAGVTCGIIFALMLMLLYEKSYKKAVFSVVWMLIGFLIVLLPIISIFIIEKACSELWYGLYEFNHKYAISAFGWHRVLRVAMMITPSILVILLICCLCKLSRLKAKIKLLIFIVSIFTTVSLFPGYAFGHYFVNYSPIICCSLIVLGVFIEDYLHVAKIKKYLLVSASSLFLVTPFILLFFVPTLRPAVKNQLMHGLRCAFAPERLVEDYNKYVTAKRFGELIKKSDSSKVLAIDCSAEIYFYMGIKPCNKFFFSQSTLSLADQEIKKHVVSCLDSEEHAPVWLVLPKQDMDEQQSVNKINKDFASRIKEHYYYVDSGLLTCGHSEYTYSLYRRKKTK